MQDLGYTSAADRLVIKMLKVLGFLRESGEPTERYHEFLDPSESGRVLADGLREAYGDLFQINRNASTMTLADVRGKMKTISKGGYSDAVLGKMANTFLAFAKHADFESSSTDRTELSDESNAEATPNIRHEKEPPPAASNQKSPRLVYEVNIHLPTTRDPAVYDALFASLSKHLDL